MSRVRYNPHVKRLLRILLNAATAVSLVLCVATIVLWVRGYWGADGVEGRTAGGWRAVRSAGGAVEVGLLLVDWSDRPAKEFHGPRYQRDAARPPWDWTALL